MKHGNDVELFKKLKKLTSIICDYILRQKKLCHSRQINKTSDFVFKEYTFSVIQLGLTTKRTSSYLAIPGEE